MAHKHHAATAKVPKQNSADGPEHDRWRNYGRGSYGSDESYRKDFNDFSQPTGAIRPPTWDHNENSKPHH